MTTKSKATDEWGDNDDNKEACENHSHYEQSCPECEALQNNMNTITAEDVRYVELAPRPVLPLIEQTVQAIEQLQDIEAERQEHFVGLYLNARHELIHKELISIGTANASIVHPRDVFAPAIMHNAVAVIVAHNHPSGDATPSPEDKDVTHRLKEGGRLLGISVLEHIIITEYGYSTL